MTVLELTACPAVVHSLLHRWAYTLPYFTDVELRHEACRVECLRPSAAAWYLRSCVDAELAHRGVYTRAGTP